MTKKYDLRNVLQCYFRCAEYENESLECVTAKLTLRQDSKQHENIFFVTLYDGEGEEIACRRFCNYIPLRLYMALRHLDIITISEEDIMYERYLPNDGEPYHVWVQDGYAVLPQLFDADDDPDYEDYLDSKIIPITFQ